MLPKMHCQVPLYSNYYSCAFQDAVAAVSGGGDVAYDALSHSNYNSFAFQDAVAAVGGGGTVTRVPPFQL
jgi:hypothetical protein